MPSLTNNLRTEYYSLFNTCNINPNESAAVEKIINRILPNKYRYIDTVSLFNVPWYFIAVIHNMESGLSFNGHFHNGDPLSARTIRVPVGRPINGDPPFTWEESTRDAIQYKKLDRWNDWSAAGLLYKLEEYNGWGYRSKHPHVLSPYLWSFSNHYVKGKYVADGTWSENAVSRQCGAAVILRRLAEHGEISLTESRESDIPSAVPLIKYSNKKSEYAKKFQAFLNKMPGIYLKEDGIAGEKTSSAANQVLGY